MAATAVSDPALSVIMPPMASSARKDTAAPIAVCATRKLDMRRADFAVNRSAKSSSVWLATQRL